MDSGPLVVDISSDEGGDDDDHDWISELLEEVERRGDGLLDPKERSTAEGLDDDCVVLDGDPEKVDVVEGNAAAESDDLLVVGVKGQSQTPSNVVCGKACACHTGQLNRACFSNLTRVMVMLVILADSIEFKTSYSQRARLSSGINAASFASYLKIACRDYPHSRHLCANFPFTSSPHDRHCHQCHCYVCDSLAPCVHWGDGTSSIDHCHANDKDEFWISRRQYSKQGDKAPLPVHKFPDTSPSALPQQNQCPAHTWLPPDSAALNQIFRPTTIRACTTSTSLGIPNITSQGRSQQYAHVLSRNNFQPHLVSQHLLSARNDFIQGDPMHDSGNLGPHVINSRKVFKRAGSGFASTTNRSGYGSFYNDLLTQYCRNASGAAASNDKNPSRWQGFHPNRINSNRNAFHPPSHQNMSSIFVNSVPFQTQVYSQPIPAVNDMQVGFQQVNEDFSALDQQFSEVDTSSIPRTGQSNEQYLPYNSQVLNAEFDPPPSHQNMSSVFVNSVPSQTQVYSQPIPAVNDMHAGFQQVNEDFCALDQQFSEVDTSSIPRTGQSNEQYLPYNFQVLRAEFDPPPSHQNMSSVFGNSVPSQTQVYSQPIPALNDMHAVFQQVNEDFSALDQQFSEVDASSIPRTGQSNEQYLPDNSQVLSAKFDPQIPVKTNPGSMDVLVDGWMLENQPALGALEVSEPSGLYLYSPEPAPVDTGIFLDF
ncbi:hypothetical protein RHMOL_Rhmol01G0346400 [Rhododendron molle]|uniref:Uncharacterized protein n=1 Tax=Rhododendron molle TaxID=49168 RepID=A0ACC0QA44_RHOML|nr:hypothetical protein RHMOL_Rhmol01G0346400 [Rhododendron molle]